MKATGGAKQGSTLLLSMSCIAGLAIAAALTLQRVSPRFQMAAQAAAWQEARLSAESGIDVALVELEQNALGFNAGSWNGWSQYDQGGPPPTMAGGTAAAPLPASAGGGKNGKGSGKEDNGNGNSPAKIAAKAAKKAKKSGKEVAASTQTLGFANSLLAILGNPVQVSQPIFLDNLQGVSTGNRPTNVDVQLWAVYPTPNPYTRWYRLRSVATIALPPLATRTTDRKEGELRRFSLRKVREQLRAYGDASIAAAFYGPQYDVRLSDNVEWFGSVAARSFEMLGGGAGGLHYDESLALVGAPIGFRIARYIEDVRQ